jgi:nitrogen-specific signal transduction histidine kinase
MDAQSFHSPLSHFDATGLIDSLAVPLLVLDADCCVVFANASARSLLSLSLRELPGQPLDLLFADGQILRATLARLFTDDTRVRSPLRVAVRELARPDRQFALKVQTFEDEYSGPHLLVEMARVRMRRRRATMALLPVLATERSSERTQLECA